MKRRAVACEWGTPQTKRSVTGQSQPSSPLDPFQDYIVQNYHAVTSYRLGHINSLFINDNKIYNLLENSMPKRTFRCNCLKSFCQAKYCECFRNAQICTPECNCKDCSNTTCRSDQPRPQNHWTCKCVKSSCLKKYCDCFQNGQRCGEKCQCVDCRNMSKEDLL